MEDSSSCERKLYCPNSDDDDDGGGGDNDDEDDETLSNVMVYSLFSVYYTTFCFPVYLSGHTIPRHIISISAYYFTTYKFCELVSCPNIPDEDWYWPVEISYTQAYSRCLISPCSSLFDFHFYFYRF